LIVAGLPSLISSGAKSLFADKAGEFLSPQQMELARFAMNPQVYLAEKGISAVADLLGYGSAYKELQAGAKDEKDYYKETMRDALGNILPGAVGDFVRATPKGVDSPAGMHTVWNPETQSYEQNQSSSPVGTFDPFSNQRFDAKYNPNSMFNVDSPTYMGAQAPGSLQPQVNTTDLLQLLDQYRQTDNNQTNSNDYGSNNSRVENLDFGGTMDYGDVLGSGYSDFGGGSTKNSFDELVASYAGGGKVCGCK
jgi:hypothetical protein